MNILDTDEFARYQMTGGTECPHCGSKKLLWPDEIIAVNDATASQKVECKDCGEQWVDQYKLEYVEIVNVPFA